MRDSRLLLQLESRRWSHASGMDDILSRQRGSDGEGFWIYNHCGLGHRYLAIIDLAGGAQPMAAAGRRRTFLFTVSYTITANCVPI